MNKEYYNKKSVLILHKNIMLSKLLNYISIRYSYTKIWKRGNRSAILPIRTSGQGGNDDPE